MVSIFRDGPNIEMFFTGKMKKLSQYNRHHRSHRHEQDWSHVMVGSTLVLVLEGFRPGEPQSNRSNHDNNNDHNNNNNNNDDDTFWYLPPPEGKNVSSTMVVPGFYVRVVTDQRSTERGRDSAHASASAYAYRTPHLPIERVSKDLWRNLLATSLTSKAKACRTQTSTSTSTSTDENENEEGQRRRNRWAAFFDELVSLETVDATEEEQDVALALPLATKLANNHNKKRTTSQRFLRSVGRAFRRIAPRRRGALHYGDTKTSSSSSTKKTKGSGGGTSSSTKTKAKQNKSK